MFSNFSGVVNAAWGNTKEAQSGRWSENSWCPLWFALTSIKYKQLHSVQQCQGGLCVCVLTIWPFCLKSIKTQFLGEHQLWLLRHQVKRFLHSTERNTSDLGRTFYTDSEEHFNSLGQQPCKLTGTKEIVYIRKEFHSYRIGLVHQHDRRFIVLEHQYDCREVMWKRSIPIKSFNRDPCSISHWP